MVRQPSSHGTSDEFAPDGGGSRRREKISQLGEDLRIGRRGKDCHGERSPQVSKLYRRRAERYDSGRVIGKQEKPISSLLISVLRVIRPA